MGRSGYAPGDNDDTGDAIFAAQDLAAKKAWRMMRSNAIELSYAGVGVVEWLIAGDYRDVPMVEYALEVLDRMKEHVDGEHVDGAKWNNAIAAAERRLKNSIRGARRTK